MWNTIDVHESTDTNVKKYIFTKEDAIVESVLYRYPTYDERTVICCSTQSGCPIGCRFCGSGDYFVRNLTVAEIISQPIKLLQDTGVNPNTIKKLQIMVMSMGEPVLNKNLADAFKILHADYPHAQLLISTSAPDVDYEWIMQISEEIPTIGLQFSVHESTDEARNQLIPFKKKLTLQQIAECGERWFKRTGRHPFFNYCVHDGNNSGDDVARLHALFKPEIWNATISVICERDEAISVAHERQETLTKDFMNQLLQCGYNVRRFDPAGQDDIAGGCGQLWQTQEWMQKNPQWARPSVGFKIPIVHAPQ